MIYDNISNIDLYKGISTNIHKGLQFLKLANPNIANGIYEINPFVKAIVSEYETKVESDYYYESHKKYIDIQYTLCGHERIACLPIEKMTETKPYSEEEDAVFYTTNTKPVEITIGDGYFTIFFPEDGHMPQLCTKKPMFVKKVVIKVSVDTICL